MPWLSSRFHRPSLAQLSPKNAADKGWSALKSLWQWPLKTRYLITTASFCVLLFVYMTVVERYFPEESYTAIHGTAVIGSAVYQSSSDDIAVVELSDRYLSFVGESWPPSYAAYAAMLEDVALYQPASIFVDIAWVHERPDDSLAQLIDSLCSLHAQNIRVYLAGLENEQHQLRLRKELEADQVRACYTAVGIRYSPAPNTKLALTYPLISPGQVGDQPGGQPGIPSAAYAIAADHDRDSKLAQALQASSAERTMALTWSLEQHTPTQWTLWEGCSTTSSAVWELLPKPLRQLVQDSGWLAAKHTNLNPACPSHRHVPLNLITDPQTQETRDWLRRNLQAKHVMIGPTVAGVNDMILSPIHGSIPGVYLHAMALDNLLTYGADFKQSGNLHERNLPLFFGLALVLGLINYRVYVGLHRWLERFDRKEEGSQFEAEKKAVNLQFSFTRTWAEIQHFAAWSAVKLVEICFSVLLSWSTFYVMHHVTNYSIQDLAQIIGVVLALQWTGVTANVINAVIRSLCVPATAP